MDSRRNAHLVIVCLLGFALAIFGCISVSIAGTYREEFDGNDIDTNLWEVMAVGDASYKLEDGQLIMDSPDVGDGLLIYWRGGGTFRTKIFPLKLRQQSPQRPTTPG